MDDRERAKHSHAKLSAAAAAVARISLEQLLSPGLYFGLLEGERRLAGDSVDWADIFGRKKRRPTSSSLRFTAGRRSPSIGLIYRQY